MAGTKQVNRIRLMARKMLKSLGEIDESKADIVKSLVEEAAFMRVTLEDLRETITACGVAETYRNGENQQGRKKTAEVDVYNTMIKNYNSTVKQIITIVADQAGGGEVSDGFDEFVAMH